MRLQAASVFDNLGLEHDGDSCGKDAKGPNLMRRVSKRPQSLG